MYRKLFVPLSVVLITMLSAAASAGQSEKTSVDKKDVILTVAGEDVSKNEFERVYKKNNIKETSFDRKSVTDYLGLYINYKLKVKEAFDLGMDTVKSFIDELAGYRKQLAQPYLTDKEVTDKLIHEAYDRMKYDVRASHVLIKVAPDALPKDTLEAYNRALKIREELVKGADFATVAKAKSEEPSAKESGGDLGYFTGLQMVYPFENAVYNAKIGELSMPVRSRFGYHIVKVVDKRPAVGEIKVAHIVTRFNTGGKAEDSTKALNKINELYSKLKAGESFEELAKQHSEDPGSARAGGALPVFGTGRMVPEFERAAFALKNVGDYSQPIQTSYGWHIIKLLEKKPIGTFEELQADIKQKISKGSQDSRSELSKSSMINKIKTKYNFKETTKSKDEFMKVVDTTLAEGKWTADRAAALKNSMFTLGNKTYTQADFAEYVASHQARRSGSNPQALVNTMYNDWVNESVLAYEESKLDENYPEFKALMQEYRDGILLFELTDKKVWSKAVKDTTGLKEFYEKNKKNYMWGDRVEATVYTAANVDVAKETRKLMKTIDDNDTLMARINKDKPLNLQVKEGKFQKGENDIIDQIEWKPGTSKDIQKGNQTSFVVVKRVIPAQPKTLEEAKGIITADYQSYLEKEWIDSLKAKYPVMVHQEVVDSIIK